MIKVDVLVFNPFQENTYVIYDETNECVVVDPGCLEIREEERLKKHITDKGLKPILVLNTHLHPDHVFGNRFVCETWDVPSKAHADDTFFIDIVQSYAMQFGIKVNENPPAITSSINDGDQITFGKSSLTVIHVPGHSPGGVAFYNQSHGIIITGDALFKGSIGRTDLVQGDYDALISGIREKLLTLPDETVVFPGHGPSSTIGAEKSENPFLV
jgi:glyoxylase-like metal-dependent hydrolase (beta-lactamase superfamily II)